MSRFATAVARRRSAFAQYRAERASIRDERAFRQIIAAAPTRESAHELASLSRTADHCADSLRAPLTSRRHPPVPRSPRRWAVTPAGSDTWASGERYEPYVGRWSRLVARAFVAWLDQPAGLRWLDVGCGTGALTETVLRDAEPSSVARRRPSPAFLASRGGRGARPAGRLRPRRRSRPAGADGAVDVVVSGLVLNFLPSQRGRPAGAAPRRGRRHGRLLRLGLRR